MPNINFIIFHVPFCVCKFYTVNVHDNHSRMYVAVHDIILAWKHCPKI